MINKDIQVIFILAFFVLIGILTTSYYLYIGIKKLYEFCLKKKDKFDKWIKKKKKEWKQNREKE